MADPQENTVAAYDPDGVIHKNVPESHLKELVDGGGMPAVRIQTPEQDADGNPVIRYVPASHTNEAVQSGGKLLPFEQQEVKHPGFWSTLYDEATSLGKSILTAGPTSGTGPSSADIAYEDKLKAEELRANGYSQAAISKMQPEEVDAALAKAPGAWKGKAYRLMMSLTPEAERESAESGDVAGVYGHAMGKALPVASGLLSPKVTPKITEFGAKLSDALSTTTPKQAAQVAGGATGAGLGHGTFSAPGLYYGAKGAGAIVEGVLGKERANQPIIAPKAQPAPFPEVPAREVLQASPLATVGQPIAPEPAAALGRIPLSGIADAPPKVVLQAVDEAGPGATPQQIAEKVAEIQKAPNKPPTIPAAKQYVHPNVENFGLDLTKAPEKTIDTDAFSKATAQARSELGPDADLKTKIIPRRDQILREQGVEAPKGDIGEQSRKDNPEPSRAESRTAKEPSVPEQGPQPVPVPEPPQIRAKQAPPTPEDVAETETIRDQVRRAAEAEDAARLREIKGQRKMSSDPNALKGNLTGQDQFLKPFAPEGRSDVSINRPIGSEVSAPEATQLPEIENVTQAMRQLENLQQAGASKNAISDFERRASVKFGEDWKQKAAHVDDLEQLVRESLKPENLAKFRRRPPS